MANVKSAAKRSRQSVKRATKNRSVLTRLRKLQRRVRGGQGGADEVRALVSAIDKAAKSGVIHRNAANRSKARLNRARAAKK